MKTNSNKVTGPDRDAGAPGAAADNETRSPAGPGPPPYSYDWIDNRGRRSPRELAGLPEPQAGERFTTAGVVRWAGSSRSIPAGS